MELLDLSGTAFDELYENPALSDSTLRDEFDWSEPIDPEMQEFGDEDYEELLNAFSDYENQDWLTNDWKKLLTEY